MHALAGILLTTIAAGSSPAVPGWEKVFDATSYGGGISTIQATGRDSWIAGGAWGVATATAAGVQVQSTRGHGVLGLSMESPESVYALGEGELIWHFDGKTWTEEHASPLPSKQSRRTFAAHMLYQAYVRPAPPNLPLVAFGLSLVLVKQPDGTWTSPPSSKKQNLLELGQLGPATSRPPKCDAAGWVWLGKNRGALYCHDRRIFTFKGERPTSKGQLPRECFEGLHALVEAQGELFASCQGLTLWRTQGQTWLRLDAPDEKGLKEIPAISVSAGCVFAAGRNAVWRRCGD